MDVSTATLDLRLSQPDRAPRRRPASSLDAASRGHVQRRRRAAITKASGAGTASFVSASDVAVAYAGSPRRPTSSSGVSLTATTPARHRLHGWHDADDRRQPAFTATGGGTVNVCDENPQCGERLQVVNTLTTTTGTALNVANTTIGAE